MNEAIQKLAVMLIGAAVIGLYAHAFIRIPDKYASKGMVKGMNEAVVKRVAALESLSKAVHSACATLEQIEKRLENIEGKLP